MTDRDRGRAFVEAQAEYPEIYDTVAEVARATRKHPSRGIAAVRLPTKSQMRKRRENR